MQKKYSSLFRFTEPSPAVSIPHYGKYGNRTILIGAAVAGNVPSDMTCAPSEHSDQTVRSRSLESSLGVFRIGKDAKFLHTDNEDFN